jgi:hypothetical protein
MSHEAGQSPASFYYALEREYEESSRSWRRRVKG